MKFSNYKAFIKFMEIPNVLAIRLLNIKQKITNVKNMYHKQGAH